MSAPPPPSQYDIQASTWAAKWGITMTATFIGHRLYFADDADTRDVYSITLTRRYPSPHPAEKGAPITRTMTFDYGQSLVNSSRCTEAKYGPYWERLRREQPNMRDWPRREQRNAVRVPPTLYDILTSIEKSDPGTFEQWCGDFGADTGSRKALGTYLAVQKQALDFRRLCNHNEEMIREAQEIQ